MKPAGSNSFPTIKPIQSTVGLEESAMYTKAMDTSIGAILIGTGKLTLENAQHILQLQMDGGKRFGDIAIELGLLTEDDIRFALARQFDNFYLPADDTSFSRQLVAIYEPSSALVEKIRILRSQLMLRWFNAEEVHRGALAIVSARDGEGRSFMAANLAIVFAQLGNKTLLIDADLRKPCQHELFHIDNKLGLSGVLSGRIGIEAIFRIASLPRLHVLPAGIVPPNPHELISRNGLAELLASLDRDFDTIIVDTPAAREYAEAQIIAARAAGALVLARKNHSSMTELVKLTLDLRQTGTNLVGSVLNDF